MPITVKSPDYYQTVLNAYLATIASSTGGVNTYDTPFAVNEIKEVGVSEQRTESKIYASGTVFKQTSKHTATNLGVSAIMLPRDFVREVLGRSVDANGGMSFATGKDTSAEFAFGYTFEYSNGDKVFIWHPRCVLTSDDKTVKTSDGNALDPATSYSIVALPYGPDMIIQAEYDQSLVSATKVPLTEDAFFATVVSTLTDARIGTETTAP